MKFVKKTKTFFSHLFTNRKLMSPKPSDKRLKIFCTTSGGTFLISKLADGRCQIQSPDTLVDLVFGRFSRFSPKLA